MQTHLRHLVIAHAANKLLENCAINRKKPFMSKVNLRFRNSSSCSEKRKNDSKPFGWVITRGGVEDTRLEAKAKDTKKIRGQGQGQPFRGQALSRPRTGMLEAKAKDQGHKRKYSPKKKGLRKNFSGDLQKKRGLHKHFSSAPQNFNNSKNTAVLEPRTGQFSRTWGLEAKAKDLTFEAKAKDFKMCSRGLHLWSLHALRYLSNVRYSKNSEKWYYMLRK